MDNVFFNLSVFVRFQYKSYCARKICGDGAHNFTIFDAAIRNPAPCGGANGNVLPS